MPSMAIRSSGRRRSTRRSTWCRSPFRPRSRCDAANLKRDIFAELGPFDLIFSCGLFDYLRTLIAVALTTTLFHNLSPSGSLYIGNQAPSSTSRWAIELLCDWYLILSRASRTLANRQRSRPFRASDDRARADRHQPAAQARAR